MDFHGRGAEVSKAELRDHLSAIIETATIESVDLWESHDETTVLVRLRKEKAK